MLTNTAASHKLLYESTEERPDCFVTGMGLMIEAFEEKLAAISPGHTFDFTLPPDKAFGEREEEKIIPVSKKTFEIKGKFDEENIFPGAEVPLMNNEGDHFYGTVVKVTDTEVVLDLNHTLAGKAIQFVGVVIDNHEATLEEIARTSEILSGEGGCSGCEGCSNCGGGCHGCCE